MQSEAQLAHGPQWGLPLGLLTSCLYFSWLRGHTFRFGCFREKETEAFGAEEGSRPHGMAFACRGRGLGRGLRCRPPQPPSPGSVILREASGLRRFACDLGVIGGGPGQSSGSVCFLRSGPREQELAGWPCLLGLLSLQQEL